MQSLLEVAHQAAADAAGVHLGDLDAGLLEKAAVDADLTEFVFDEHQLFAAVGLGDELADQSGFTGSQKAGEDIDFGHKNKDRPFLPPGFGGYILRCPGTFYRPHRGK